MFLKKVFIFIVLFQGGVCHAAVDWLSFTWDNDIFVGSDDGYTNGGFWTWFDTGRRSGKQPEAPWLVTPLLWSLSEQRNPLYTVNADTFGQMMVTPEDIEAQNPDPNDIPYSGLLYYVSSHLKVYEDYADMAAVTIGIIGPASGAEETQKLIHRWLGSDDPQGWEYQLDNELVFRLTRNRIWRAWASAEDGVDFLWAAGLNIGTLESSVGGFGMIRYGTNLEKSYATAVYHSSRAINPIALDGGWHFYFGMGARYVGNLIFTDGNTFKDSRSVELDPGKIGIAGGFSYSWQNFAVTMALEDMAINEEEYEGIERYGSVTFAYRFQ